MFKMKRDCLPMIFLVTFALFSSLSHSDEISFYNDVVKRFSHKDWVAYKTETGHCRPTVEFLIGGTIVKLAILRRDSSNRDSHAWGHLYGKYPESVTPLANIPVKPTSAPTRGDNWVRF